MAGIAKTFNASGCFLVSGFKNRKTIFPGCKKADAIAAVESQGARETHPVVTDRPVSPGFKIGHTPQKFPVSKNGHLLHHRISACNGFLGIDTPLPISTLKYNTIQSVEMQAFFKVFCIFFSRVKSRKTHNNILYFCAKREQNTVIGPPLASVQALIY